MEREGETDARKAEQQSTPPRQRQYTEQKIAGNANGRNWHALDHGVGAVVHDAAIPARVDVAGLGAVRVVNLESERGYDQTGEGERDKEKAHGGFHSIGGPQGGQRGPAIYDVGMNEPASRERVAFFGGSFDPPHLGHLAVARAARAALNLDTVLFAPVGAQPLKPQGSTAAFEDRLAMTRLAIAGEAGFAISLADAPRDTGAPNFTLETLERLRNELPPGAALFCLMGADSFWGLRHWHRAAEIPFAAPLVVASRPGQPVARFEAGVPAGLALEPAREETRSGIVVREFFIRNGAGRRAPFYLLPGLDVEISASEIRANIAAGPSADLMPGAVAEYIRSHELYR